MAVRLVPASALKEHHPGAIAPPPPALLVRPAPHLEAEPVPPGQDPETAMEPRDTRRDSSTLQLADRHRGMAFAFNIAPRIQTRRSQFRGICLI